MSRQQQTANSNTHLDANLADEGRGPRLIHRATPPPRRGFRPLRWFLVGVISLAVMVALAPTIVGKTGVGDWLLRQVVPSSWGTVEIAQRDLGWWHPISVGGVRLRDAGGEILAEVGTLRTKETLWQILTTAAVSEVHVEQAAVRLQWRSDGSNWEDWIAAVLRDAAPPDDAASSSAVPDLLIHFHDCQVILDSQTDQQQWLAEGIQGEIAVQQNARHIVIQSSAQLRDTDQNLAAGRCEATLLLTDQSGLRAAGERWQLHTDDPQTFQINTTTGGLAFSVQLDDMAASIGRSIVRRYLPTLELSGLASGQVAGLCNWYGDYLHVATPKLVLSRVAISDQELTAGDELRWQQLETMGAVAAFPTGLSFQQLKVVGDYVRSDLDGRLDYDEILNAFSTRRLPTTTLTSNGSIQLAGLVNQLPRLLQLQEDLVVEQGELSWQLFNRPEADGSQRLFVDLVAKNIAGRQGLQRVQWREPIRLSSSLRDYHRPVTFDHLDVQSDFLQASARPQPDGGTQIDFELSFDRLRVALEQFFQLPPVVLQGQANGQAVWQMLARDGRPASLSEPATGMEIQAVIGLAGAHIVLPEYLEISEPNLSLNLGTRMQWGNAQTETQGWLALLETDADVTVQSARVELVSQRPPVPGAGGPAIAPAAGGGGATGMGLLVQLKQPVHLPRLNQVIQYLAGTAIPPANPAQVPVLEAEVAVSGPLDQWLAMIRPLLAGIDIAMTGQCQGKFNLTLNERFALVSHLQGSSQQFGFRGYGLLLHEPVVQTAGAVSYHYANGLIHTEDFQLTGNSLAIRAMKTRLQFAPLNRRLEGEFLLRGDVARLWHTYQLMQMAAEGPEPTRLGNRRLDLQPLPKMKSQPAFDQILLVGHSAPDLAVGNAIAVASANPPVPAGPAPLGMGGDLSAKVDLKTVNQANLHLEWQAQVKEAWVGNQQPNGAWVAWLKERVVESNGTADLPLDFSRVELPNVYVGAQSLRGVAAGRVTELTTQPQLDLRGQVESAAMDWLRQFGGAEVANLEIRGLQMHDFAVLGPLSLSEMRGRWISSWQEIRWMGLQSGPADIVVNLEQGIARMVPLRFAAGGGQIHLAPEVDLRHDPVWIRLPRGVIFDQVKLTPQICRNFLKYSAPLLAEVTSVQGSFSLDSDGIEVPLSDWTKLVAKARVTINGARVGPGPLGIQIGNIASTVRAVADGQSLDAAGLQALGMGGLAGLAASGDGQRTQALSGLAGNVLGALGSGQRPDLGNLVGGQAAGVAESAGDSNVTWLEIPAQTIAVNLQDGAVVHDRLKMSIKGFEFESQGRVGLDQSVALQTQLKMPADVAEKNPRLAAALGPSIQLPISGTLTQPTLQAEPLRTALNTAVTQGLQQQFGAELERRLGIGLPGGADPVPELLQEGQRRLENKIQDRLNLPGGNLNPGGLLPGGLIPGGLLPNTPSPGNPPASGNTSPATSPAGQLPPPGSPTTGSPPAAAPGSAGTLPPVREAEDAVNRWLNQSLERGRQRILGGGN